MSFARLASVLSVAICALLAVFVACLPKTTAAPAQEPAHYVGGAACAGCHATEAGLWRNSHHARAMQPATKAAVLGDFAGAKLDHADIGTVFHHNDTDFSVSTDGPDGANHDYHIDYTFGVDPLQQYLIAMPGGRYQALGVAWGSRPKEQGGQRWFHLYPGHKLTASDPMHWTGREQTWNYQCASCHSTDLHKNFDLAKRRCCAR